MRQFKKWQLNSWFSPVLFLSLFVGACSYFADNPFRLTPAVGKHWQERTAPADKSSTAPDFTKLNRLFINLSDQLSPSVVNIYTKTKIKFSKRPGFFSGPGDDLFQFFFGTPHGPQFRMPLEQEASSLGSGFVLNKKGIVITNSHVIRPNGQNADEIMVKFKDQKGRGFPAKIVGFDESTDVAVLKLKNKPDNLKPVFLGSSDSIQVGEWVLAIGNPYGHANTVTQGIVSALGRHLEGLENRADFIQTSANINPGNSGGPLFNLKGEVVGINTAIDARAQGIGFSIPISLAKPIIEQLLENGSVTRGWIGIGIADLTPDLKESLETPVEQGVVVQSIEKGEPAEKAGLKVYDVIVKVNERQTSNARELSNAIAGIRPGKKAKLELYREGKKKTIKVKVAKRPSDQELTSRTSEQEAEAKEIEGKLGLALIDLTPVIRRKYNIDRSIQGVLVTNVAQFSPASQIGFSRGDVITEVNKTSVTKVDQILKSLESARKSKDKVLFRVLKANGWSTLIVFDSELLK